MTMILNRQMIIIITYVYFTIGPTTEEGETNTIEIKSIEWTIDWINN